jgi:hypothetical protein
MILYFNYFYFNIINTYKIEFYYKYAEKKNSFINKIIDLICCSIKKFEIDKVISISSIANN